LSLLIVPFAAVEEHPTEFSASSAVKRWVKFIQSFDKTHTPRTHENAMYDSFSEHMEIYAHIVLLHTHIPRF